MLKQQLRQQLQQKLSPQQIQVIRLLELPAIELEEKVKHELEENPALEEGKEMPDEFDQADGEIGENSDSMTENNEGEDDLSLGDYLTEDETPRNTRQIHKKRRYSLFGERITERVLVATTRIPHFAGQGDENCGIHHREYR